MPSFTHSASSGQFVAVITDADGNVFDRRASAFVAPARLTGREKEASIPMSGPVDGAFTGEVDGLPPGVYTANIFAASSGYLSQAAIDGTITPTATATVVQNPPQRDSWSTAAVTVEAGLNAAYNGAALLAAYEQSTALTPNGAALAASNRATVIVEPGVYDLDGETLTLDTQFVDIKGLDQANTLITSTATAVAQTADDAAISGVTLECTNTASLVGDRTDPAAYAPDRDLSAAKLNGVTLKGTNNGKQTVLDVTNADAFVGTYENVRLEGVASTPFGKIGGTFRNVRGSMVWGVFVEAAARLYNCEGPTGSFASKNASAKTLFCVVNDAAFANND